MVQPENDRPCVLITGGSLGIGLEFAKLFAADRNNLIIVSKPVEELEACKQLLQASYPDIEILTIQKDLATQDAAREVYEEIKKTGIEIDVLVNNAGVATYGYVNDIPVEREVSMVNLNVVTVYQLTRLFLSDMMKKNQGKILNVSSSAGFAPFPLLSTYGATKSFIHHFSLALNHELKQAGSPVSITTLCPPAVKNTGFGKAAGAEGSKLFNNPMTLEAPEVARAGYKGLLKGKSRVIPGIITKISAGAVHLMPKFLKMRILMNIT